MVKWAPGTSGNPGGKPRSAHLRALCREFTEAAVKELARLALEATGQMVRVQAIRELLDRGYGRPMQALEVCVEDNRPEAAEDMHPLLPEQVAAALGEILANSEREMGINPVDGLTNEQRMKRLLESGQPLPPDLYHAWQKSTETRH